MSYLCLYSASKYGIYTLLDMHQDVLSPKFCGEGVPDWAVDTGSKLALAVGSNHGWVSAYCTACLKVDMLGEDTPVGQADMHSLMMQCSVKLFHVLKPY